MNSYNPWLDALRYPDIHIEWHAIAPLHAAWIPSEGVILVDESISQVERRCALAHELAHVDAADHPLDDGFFCRRQEAAADRLAARRLIPVHALAHAARWAHDPRELAAELGVTVRVLALRCVSLHPAERALVESIAGARDSAA